MRILSLWLTSKRLSKLLHYYVGRYAVFSFCYENSCEFKGFVDKMDEHYICKFRAKSRKEKPLRKYEEKRLSKIIKTKPFKELFTRFEDLLLINGIEKSEL